MPTCTQCGNKVSIWDLCRAGRKWVCSRCYGCTPEHTELGQPPALGGTPTAGSAQSPTLNWGEKAIAIVLSLVISAVSISVVVVNKPDFLTNFSEPVRRLLLVGMFIVTTKTLYDGMKNIVAKLKK